MHSTPKSSASKPNSEPEHSESPLLRAKLDKLRQLKALQAEAQRRESERLRGIDVFGMLGYTPTPKQKIFHDSTEFDVLFGGSAGGGKTVSLITEGIRACVRHPGIRVGAFRRTYGELKESLLAELSNFGFAGALGASWNGTEYELRFPNGSLLMFRYAESVKDASRRQGGQYQLLIFDERTLTPPDVCSFLESRLRSGRSDIPVLGIRSGTNPGGPGHGAVKMRYIKPTNYGQNVIQDERGRSVRFISSKLSDNPHVNPEYAADLQALPEKLRAAFLDGDWDTFAGMMFCYDDKTELLTASGWKPVSDVQVGELVATLSPTGEMTFQAATRVWQFPYVGDMRIHEGRALDFSVTPGHRMYARRYRSDAPFGHVAIEDLHSSSEHLRTAQHWSGDQSSTITIRVPGDPVLPEPAQEGCCTICAKPVTIPRRGMCEPCYRSWRRAGAPQDMEAFRDLRCNPNARYAHRPAYTFEKGDWCELLGWYLSEGFTTTASKRSRYGGRIYGFGIAQVEAVNGAKVARIKALLDRMGLSCSYDGHRFRVASRTLGLHFAQYGRHLDKFIPRELLNSSREHLQRLFDALIDGDGCRHREGSDASVYVTVSPQLADDVQELCIRLGRVAAISTVSPKNPDHHLIYRVSVYKSDHDRSVLRRDQIRTEPYSGVVSCVTVEPHHTVLVRRSGKAMWSGNSEISRDRHVIDPIALPASWKRYNGIDWGFSAPWAVLWAAVDEDGRVWVYRELYQRGVGEAEQARQILAAETSSEQVSVRFADDAMWATRGDAKAIAAVYADNGVHLTAAGKGAGSRVTGWQRVRSYLAEAPACPHHRAQGWETCPKIHIFSTVTELYRELSDLPHATKGDPEDADTTADDHISDALRYLLTNLGVGPEFLIVDKPPSQAEAPMQALGASMAYRPAEPAPDDAAWWLDDDDGPRPGGTVQVE
ncbi:hypothetical protein OS965_02510 [Streptomyces sp. H27-G5]|uniref:hypothetical protein n=1 Tax=Streptomyces sp. H27-G5 TaxID=2996698 RepID=UPI002271E2B8|nr:hypothetical protein [Streptomyces sp. H27-G5]MCY0917049.1 hypothetical protein [Streptomyces sp. H27-G5]